MNSTGTVLLVICMLVGCAKPRTMTHDAQHQIMREVEASRQAAVAAFPKYLGICQQEFPQSTNASSDSGVRTSTKEMVSVALQDNGNSIVCSVNTLNNEIERVWVNERTYTLTEYRSYAIERSIKLEQEKLDAVQVLSGNWEAFVHSAKRYVTNQFKDPDSALFRDIYISHKEKPTLCGEVNAKNSYGGYVGYKRFFYNRSNIGMESTDDHKRAEFERLAALYCNEKLIEPAPQPTYKPK